MLILGIETSCDETAAAVLQINKNNVKVLSNTVASQISIHRKYGGVVPEVAAREHIKKIIPVIKEALNSSKHSLSNIDLIAVTKGPGLITSLLVGIEAAKTLSFAKKIPLMGINHLKAHIYANFLKFSNILHPAISLIASGGHTELGLLINNNYKKLGQTRDDAAGECFDKTAKILGLKYPGGPEISKQAEKWEEQPKTIKKRFKVSLPRPMINSKNFDFSFSGLKTAILYKTKENEKIKNRPEFIQSISYEAQKAIVEVLTKKTIKAAQKYKAKSILLSGGVAANKALRQTFKTKIKKLSKNIKFLVPAINNCTDNAAMIAITAYYQHKTISRKQKDRLNKNWFKLKANPNLKT